jgi:hypothetical protein
MKTAMEWLEFKLMVSMGEEFNSIRGYFVMAKEMEAEQIIDAYQSDRVPCSDQDAIQYYLETYGGDK